MLNDFDVLDYFRQWPIMTGQQLFGVTGNDAASPGAAANGGLMPLPNAGATGLSGQPLQRMPVTVQPAIRPPAATVNPAYPNPYQMMSMLYGESGGAQDVPGMIEPGQTVDDLQHAQANVILNRIDQNVDHPNRGGYEIDNGINLRPDVPGAPPVARDYMMPDQWKAMSGQLLAGNPQTYDAWMRSLGAGLDALGRSAAPTSGPGSAIMFNDRSNASQAPNVETSPSGKVYTRPSVGTMGPYHYSNGDFWTAFFGKP